MYPKYLKLVLENLQILTSSHFEILLDCDNNDYMKQIFLISYTLLKTKLEEEHFATDSEKNISEEVLNMASTIIHNICYFCCDKFNFRFSPKISQNMKHFLDSTKELFYESMKFLFEVGINFPEAMKKHGVIVTALFPMIVLNRNVINIFDIYGKIHFLILKIKLKDL